MKNKAAHSRFLPTRVMGGYSGEQGALSAGLFGGSEGFIVKSVSNSSEVTVPDSQQTFIYL